MMMEEQLTNLQSVWDLLVEGHNNLTQALFPSDSSVSSSPGIFDFTLQWRRFYDAFMGFIYAIRWTEPFIILSYSVLALWFILVLLCLGKKWTFGTVMLLTIQCMMVLALQPLNTVAAEHWTVLTTQNYFDTKGVFVSLFYGLPFIVFSLIQVVRHIQL